MPRRRLRAEPGAPRRSLQPSRDEVREPTQKGWTHVRKALPEGHGRRARGVRGAYRCCLHQRGAVRTLPATPSSPWTARRSRPTTAASRSRTGTTTSPRSRRPTPASHQERLGRRPVQQPAGLHRPPAGRHADRRVLRLHDRPAAGARLRPGRGHHQVRQRGHDPDLGQRARRGEEPVHRRRQDLRHPDQNYSMGLVYNKKLFKQAGLDPTKPADDLGRRSAAPPRRSPRSAPGIAGYSEYSAGNTGGWHFTAALYSHGGSLVSADGKKADFNNAEAQGRAPAPQGHAVTRQQHGRQAAARLAGPADQRRRRQGRHVHRCARTPSPRSSPSSRASTRTGRWRPMPGQDGPAKGTLGGGEGYFFKKGLSADQIKAGLKWLAYEKLTPGKGQFDYVRAKPRTSRSACPSRSCSGPGSAAQKQELELARPTPTSPSTTSRSSRTTRCSRWPSRRTRRPSTRSSTARCRRS